MATQAAWIGNVEILQRKVFELIGRVTTDVQQIHLLLDQSAMDNYWKPAFTHESVDAVNNYESLELYGDAVLGYAFLMYLRELAKAQGRTLTAQQGTLLLNEYMSKDYQAKLATQLGLVEYVRYDPGNPKINKSVREDVFEAFFGALNNIADDRLAPGVGYIFCYNLLREIFGQIPIRFDEIRQDVITQLKEIHDKMAWGQPQVVPVKNDRPELGEYKIEIRALNGEVLGTGYGSRDEAERRATEVALQKLAQRGITRETADERKLEKAKLNNPQFELQYRRLEKAIERLNQYSTAAGRANIIEFKVVNKSSVRTGKGYRYTVGIEGLYRSPSGTSEWSTIDQYTGDDNAQARIELMKQFADKLGVPATI